MKKYFNPKQLESMAVGARDEYIIASRGFGKSEGIDGPRLIRNVFAMPRSAGALLSPTYGKLLRNTLPAVFTALERLGYKRNIHYVVGHKPPKILNYQKPIIDPFNYDYVIAWFNGSIQHLLSFDRPMSANSMNLDYIMGFEAKFLDYEKIKNEVLPANRGNNNYFGKCPWHHGLLFTTDMPTTKSGMWILDKEKDMDPDLIELIRSLYFEYKKTGNQKLRERKLRELNEFRKHAVYYAEYDAFDNLEILGDDFIKNMHRDLPPLIFLTAILNKRLRKIANGFYSALNEKLHYYNSYDNSYLESLGYDTGKSTRETCLNDGDISKDLPLSIAFDYNAAINSLVCGQRIENREARALHSFFVKTPRKLNDLVNLWCDYYDPLPHRDVVYYYDSTAIADTPLDADSFADTIIKALTKRGWSVTPVYIGQPMKHHLKHNYFDLALKGDPDYLFPTFNQDNNEYLLIAMEQTGIKVGKTGFEKNKDPEKLPDTTENPDEFKTHITDAWDTLYIGLNFHYTEPGNQVGTTHWNT
jgi:hypothetical protein